MHILLVLLSTSIVLNVILILMVISYHSMLKLLVTFFDKHFDILPRYELKTLVGKYYGIKYMIARWRLECNDFGYSILVSMQEDLK